MGTRTKVIVVTVVTVVAALIASVVLATTVSARNRTEKIEVPVCDVKGGLTMPLCLEHKANGMDYLWMDYGAMFKIVAVH
jgi:succinate dehydrogenase hydrophobic anchor subunit